jgi:DNA-binding SARP family transcriptional activator
MWGFEHVLDEASGRWSQFEKEAVRLTHQALALYQGSFLKTEGDNGWIVATRERLRRKFIRATLRLGAYYQQSGELEKALDCYDRGLDADDLVEDFYRGLMYCYIEQGQYSRAREIYQQCKFICATTEGQQLSTETVALLRRIPTTPSL